MAITIKPEHSTIYYIIYSDDLSVLFDGSVDVGNVLTTGQPNVEEFSNEDEMKIRLAELEKQKKIKL
tara:strand:- start:1762 stop:1962 length:201 start_codon:yes stop_codon:yes gene_type:complete